MPVEVINAQTGAFVTVPTREDADKLIAKDKFAVIESISVEYTGVYYMVTFSSIIPTT
tara:strand:+ start:212 stop:385 length:174 start_codon:yes stop_codon:yes gene_type:complete